MTHNLDVDLVFHVLVKWLRMITAELDLTDQKFEALDRINQLTIASLVPFALVNHDQV